jgi:hypothetical protein
MTLCKYCGGSDLVKAGLNRLGHQQYECKDCSRRFVANGNLPHRKFSLEIVQYAQERHSHNIPFRIIMKEVMGHFGISVTDRAIWNWCTQPQFKPLPSTCRHYWLCDPPGPPNGGTSHAVCKLCGAEKDLLNYILSEYNTTSENHREKQRKLEEVL